MRDFSIKLLVKFFLFPSVLIHQQFLLIVPGQGPLREYVMIQIKLLKFFRSRGQNILAVEPAEEVRVRVEPVFI